MGIFFAVYIIFCSLTGCSSLNHKDNSFVFYKTATQEYSCTQPLAVFVDFDNTLNIYDNITRTHYSTKSRTRFLSTLSRICSENYYDHIAVLMLCSGYNKQTVLYDILQDTTLIQYTTYQQEGDTLYTTAIPLESPNPVLKFKSCPDYIYCTCAGL